MIPVNPHSDFSIEYHWMEGSLPPPYHYEYAVSLSHDGSGTVVFQPDYDQPGVPVWQRRFEVSAGNLSTLFSLIDQGGILNRIWIEPEQIRVGGSQEWCDGHISGSEIHIPAALLPEDVGVVEKFYTEIKQIVPQYLWDELYRLRKEYIKSDGRGED